MTYHKDLVFFNKEGDYLNFNYDEYLDRFNGDILFHENSSDTYKTYGINMLERVPGFEYEAPGVLTTKKWQLFNEYGMNFYGSIYKNIQVKKIEPVNNDPTFYSKWIYGDDFDGKFPVGTLIGFDNPFTEFTNSDKYYIVVEVKKNAIMIISDIDNDTFEINFFNIYDNPNNYNNITISGKNVIGVYDYVNSNLDDNLSNWNEKQFYNYYYKGRRLNIINSNKNSSTVTVLNEKILDIKTHEYHLSENDLPVNTDLLIEVITKTDLPNVYNGYVNVNNNSIININPNFYPELLKPGSEFKIIGSTNNTLFFTVSSIPDWHGIVNLTNYNIGDQVIFENKIYQCIQNYTQDFSDTATSYINPKNDNVHWSNPDYVKVDQTTIVENLLNAQIYLTINKFYYEYSYIDIDDNNLTYTPDVVLASAADKFKNDLNVFNLITTYENNELIIKSKYPSKYIEVNFYHDDIISSNKIGDDLSFVENLVEVEETLIPELNGNLSENFRYNIVFDDIDSYGIKIFINGMEYNEEFQRVNVGGVMNLERSIDRTLRKWFSRYYITLYRLGIIANLKYTGNTSSIFYNTIILKTEYPNVPLNIEKIKIGTTADFHIEHSEILFTEIGPYFNIKINDNEYGVETIYLSGNNPNIVSTIQKWMDEYESKLREFGIIVDNVNNLIKIGYNKLDGRRLEYEVKTNIRNIPGVEGYRIIPKQIGNHGVLIASNEVVLPGIGSAANLVPNKTYSTTYSVGVDYYDFVQEDFATGMVFTINNTSWHWVNQEFNIEYLDEGSLNLSYEGPFWGELDGNLCDSSAFAIIAFDNGFSATGCVEVPIGSGGEFDASEFDSSFTIEFNPNSYIQNNYNLNQYQGTTNLADLIYLDVSENLYALGDELIIFDAFLGQYVTQIDYLSSSTQSSGLPIEMKYDNYNDYLYILTEQNMFSVDPVLNTVIKSDIRQSGVAIASHFEINESDGYIYVTHINDGNIEVYNNNDNYLTLILNSTNKGGKLLNIGNFMYILIEDYVLKISGSTIHKTKNIFGLNLDFIVHNPNNNKLMVADSSNIHQLNLNDLNDDPTLTIPISSDAIDGIFNNFTYEYIIRSRNDVY